MILNFGLPAPIDIQVSGPIGELDQNYQFCAADRQGPDRRARARRTCTLQQITKRPPTHDRHRSVPVAPQQERPDRAEHRPTALSVSPSMAAAPRTTNFWLNYKNGVAYQVVVQTPQNRVTSMDR